jgi:hypothetical protein
MKRENHYEAAFEAWLRERHVPYIAVDEAKRSQLGGTSLKNLDFILSPVAGRPGLLIDVKGRRFPSGRQPHYWKNWSTRDDVNSLAHWQRLFGVQFVPLLVFAYDVAGDLAPLAQEELFSFRRRLYGFLGVRLEHYVSAARSISPRWGTLAMPATQFRQLARPLTEFLEARAAA